MRRSGVDSVAISRRTALASAAVGMAGLAACSSSGSAVASAAQAASGPAPASQFTIERFSLNLETWWRELPLHARIDAAARAGFKTAEMWGLGEGERDPGTLRQVSRDAGIEIVHCTVNVPDLAAASPAEVRSSVTSSLDQINALGARYGTVVGHKNVEGMSKGDMLKAYRDRIAEVAPLFEQADVIATIEPFNPFNHPGFFIYGADDAVAMCRAINSPNVKMNWDLFHMQRHEGNLVTRLREGFDQVGLLQIADSPDRREPGTGELDYGFVLSEALKLGFAGPMGLECFPPDGQEAQAIERIRALASELHA